MESYPFEPDKDGRRPIPQRWRFDRFVSFGEVGADADPRMDGRGHVFDNYRPTHGDGFYEKFIRGEKVSAGWVSPTDFEKQPIKP